MHFNFYFLRHLTNALRTKLIGKTITSCFSQNKDELVLVFGSKDSFTIKATFNQDISFLTFPADFKRAKKNSVDLFSHVVNKEVLDVEQYANERSFSIHFSEGHLLLFKLHGRRANICLFEGGSFRSMFINSMPNDRNLIPDKLHKQIDQTEQAILAAKFDLKSLFPTFDKNILSYLNRNNFENAATDDEKLGILANLITALENRNFYIQEEASGKPLLSLLKNDAHLEVFRTTDSTEACNQLAAHYFQVFLLKKEKAQAQAKIKKEIKKHSSYIAKSKAKLTSLTEGVKNNEIADILMANLHLGLKSTKTVELFDFYRNQNIKIKLKPDLSMQANAEIYYRKSKNQQIEINKLKQNIGEKEKQVVEAEKLMEEIASAANLKTLRRTPGNNLTQVSQKNQQTPKPFIAYQIDGYSVLVGKNAKSNDQMLRNFTSKDDLWLHARNFSGSHVIIKNNSSGQIPLITIEKAAQVAAWYSKGKTDTLCPVIYTARKYVNKPKNAEPGKVVVKREEVILVNPCQNPQ